MSDTTGSLRRKIIGAGELQSVVCTMKAVAASSIGQYEQSVNALTDYYHTIELGLSACFRVSSIASHYKRKTIPSKIGAVVFGSDQGMVGQFNDIIVDYATKTLATFTANPTKIWAVGERAHSRLSDAGLKIAGLFTVPNSIKAVISLVGQILVEIETHHNNDSVTELHLFYNRRSAATIYVPFSWQLLPLDENWQHKLAERTWPTIYLPEVIGGTTATLRALIREYLFVSLFRACSESLASENAGRLAAMQRAEKNIDELLEALNSNYHRVRQSGIDEELFDVISGFEALSTEE